MPSKRQSENLIMIVVTGGDYADNYSVRGNDQSTGNASQYKYKDVQIPGDLTPIIAKVSRLRLFDILAH